MNFKAAIFFIAVLLVTANCGLRKNNGSGYGGGDPLLAVLHDKQLQVRDSAKLILNGVDAETLCSARQCQFPNDKSQCSLLDGLSAAQRSYCASVVQASAERLQEFGNRSLGDSFLITNEAISVTDAHGSQIAVTAKTVLGRPSPIIFNRERLNFLNGSQLVALMVHEVGHQYPYLGRVISDNDAVGPFANGRSLLDAVGAAFAVYSNDHINRPGGVDYSFFNGRRILPLGQMNVLRGRMRNDARLELVSSTTSSLESGVIDLFGETVGSFDFAADEIEYKTNPEVLDSGEYDLQIVPARSGDTIYIASKFDEMTGSSLSASRFKSDGSIDSSFGDGTRPGKIQLSRTDLTEEFEFIASPQVDSLNRLHFAECISEGSSYVCNLIRLKPDGLRDADYNSRLASEIALRIPGSSVIVLKPLSDGSTAVMLKNDAGSLVLIHVLENGSIDAEFGVDGICLVEGHSQEDADFDSVMEVSSLEVADGKIVVLEQTSTRERLVLSRYTLKGVRDLSFGTSGVYSVTPTPGNAFMVERVFYQNDGKILLVGLMNSFLLKTVRLDQRGKTDKDYGELGVSLLTLGGSLQSFVDASVDEKGALTIAFNGESLTSPGNELTIMKLQP